MERRGDNYLENAVTLLGAVEPEAVGDGAEGRADQLLILDAIAELSESQREVIDARFFRGLSLKETGALLGKDHNAVSQLQHRALTRLRALLLTAMATVLAALAVWNSSSSVSVIEDDSVSNRSTTSVDVTTLPTPTTTVPLPTPTAPTRTVTVPTQPSTSTVVTSPGQGVLPEGGGGGAAGGGAQPTPANPTTSSGPRQPATTLAPTQLTTTVPSAAATTVPTVAAGGPPPVPPTTVTTTTPPTTAVVIEQLELGTTSRVNGTDASIAPGPDVVRGDMADFDVHVTNDGTVRLTNLNAQSATLGFFACSKTTVDVGESTTCRATTSSNDPGQNAVVATVTGTSAGGETVVVTSTFNFSVSEPLAPTMGPGSCWYWASGGTISGLGFRPTGTDTSFLDYDNFSLVGGDGTAVLDAPISGNVTQVDVSDRHSPLWLEIYDFAGGGGNVNFYEEMFWSGDFEVKLSPPGGPQDLPDQPDYYLTVTAEGRGPSSPLLCQRNP